MQSIHQNLQYTHLRLYHRSPYISAHSCMEIGKILMLSAFLLFLSHRSQGFQGPPSPNQDSKSHDLHLAQINRKVLVIQALQDKTIPSLSLHICASPK